MFTTPVQSTDSPETYPQETLILPLADPRATLETAGGKAASLARLLQAGLPVPDGFTLTTVAYRRFVAENGLQERILVRMTGLDPARVEDLEAISREIQALFVSGEVSPEISAAISQAYAALPGENPAVAVRSSATAEDLPGLSFAGQQETYLNIRGSYALLAAVKKCWASLWTARAVAYRARQEIDPETIALAVVVQLLVPAEASGVMFTANPVDGSRDEIVITAAWGLGEAIVSGAVTPDTIAVAKAVGKVLRRETAAKEVMTVRTADGTHEQPVPPRLRRARVLNDTQAAELAGLGACIETLYGLPVDIEWTLAAGRFAIVQARPITSLPAAPLKWISPYTKALLARGSFAEFLPDPVSPLFATLAVPIAREASVEMMKSYIGALDDDSYLFAVVNSYVYIGMVITPKQFWPYLRATLFESKRMLSEANQRWQSSRQHYAETAAKWRGIDPASLSAPQLLAGAREVYTAAANYYTVLQSSVIPGAMSSEIVFGLFYNKLVQRKGEPAAVTFHFGLDNQALRAEKALFDLAQWLKSEPELTGEVGELPAAEIVKALSARGETSATWREFQARFQAYLEAYGDVVYDMDFAKPLPADEPAPLVEALKAYLSGSGSDPYRRQQEALEHSRAAEQALFARLDPLRRKWFVKLLKWARDTGPYREDGIAAIGLGYPQIRSLLGELGCRLAGGGVMTSPKDIYWLEAQEVDALAASLEAGQALSDHTQAIEQRKLRWQVARRALPPLTIPEKSWMSKLMGHKNSPDSHTLKGLGASAGQVTARACVMRGPEDFGQMQPGDVIVAVTTTPAWTPLFALASAVVTDIGGPLSHSSIVAREYGIPAVMATGSATRRIHTGQMLTVDGSAGSVTLHEP